ncbi:hypothetical protein JCM3765_007796 [Sporobolomyces pararoseus]
MQADDYDITPLPAAPLTSPGKCVVCGKSTMLRCGDCAKYGIGYMFFCSIEHKKLVYSVHRRVCGIRSNPFQWPGLSRVEFRNAEEIRTIVNLEGGTFPGAADVWDYLGLAKDPPKGERTQQGLASGYIRLRQSIFKCRLRELKLDEPDGCYFEHLLFCTATNPIDAHKMLIRVAVMQAYVQQTLDEESDDPELFQTCEYVEGELRKFCQKTISVTHPKEAKALLHMIKQWPTGRTGSR